MFPAMVIVPVLEDVLLFDPTEKLTVPFPEPLAPAVMVIQVALLVPVQLHPVVAVTLTLPVPPEEVNVPLVGLME